ncbi:MAG: signal recognition particle-docking protein FtsY [archaeon]
MFGFLKQKIASFGEKLKQTISGKADEKSKEAIEAQPKAEEKKEDRVPAVEEKKEVKKEEAKEQKKEEIKETKKEKTPEKKEEVKTTEKKQEPKKEEKKKKSREEEAAELEKKLFEEIGAELEEEGLSEETKEEEKEPAVQKHEHDRKKELEVKENTPLGESRRDKHRKEKEEKETKKEEPTKVPSKLPQAEEETEDEKREEEKALEEAEEEIEGEEEEKEKTEQIQSISEELPDEDLVAQTVLEEETKNEDYDKKIDEKREELKKVEIKGAEEDKRQLKAKIGVGGKIKGFLFGGIEISEKDIEELLYELELSLLESDVEQDAAKELVSKIKERLIGTRASSKNLDEFIKQQIKEILTEMMATNKINLLEDVRKSKKEGKTYRILMLGPNGAGKTTSIAKLAKYFEKNKLTTLFAAGDTFRAAAIDQLEEHAKRLNVRVVKQQYGADPAAVAFDAIKAAEAAKIDVVLIDSAGRQETNKNLMEELKKLERVAKPNLKLYVGEAYAGQGLLDQAKEFEDIVGIDGFILTKIDTDAKGGTSISLLYKLKKPILFVGTGQEYEDLEEFTPEFILNRII